MTHVKSLQRTHRKDDHMIARVVTIGAIFFALLAGPARPSAAQGQRGGPPPAPGLTLTTPAFADGSEVPSRFTQSSQNPISPRLEWTNVPANTVTFALIMHDPDVARERKTEDMLHWVMFNIPGTARDLPED